LKCPAWTALKIQAQGQWPWLWKWSKGGAMRELHIPEVSGKLFLDSMPGRYDSVEDVIENLKTEKVTTIVVLPERCEIERQQPEYAALLRNGGPDFAQCIFLPCVDFGLPEAGTDVFVATVKAVAEQLKQGYRYYAHCAGGVGRTGTFAAAVLLALGVPMSKALRRVDDAGSRPETDEQRELLAEVSMAVGAHTLHGHSLLAPR